MAKTDEQKAQEDFDAIARAEARRKAKGAKLFAGTIVGAMFVIGLGYTIGGGFSTSVPVEKGEKETLSQTNDPQCRSMIDRVTALKKDFQVLELNMESDLLGDSTQKVNTLRKQIGDLQGKVKAEAKSSQRATLRHDDSRKQLDTWFTYLDGELATLDRVAQTQLKVLDAKAKGETYIPLKKKTKRRPNAKPPKTLEQKRDAAVLAIYDAFDKFKVWHTAGLHPCGAASEGETPWTPPAKTTKPQPKGTSGK